MSTFSLSLTPVFDAVSETVGTCLDKVVSAAACVGSAAVNTASCVGGVVQSGIDGVMNVGYDLTHGIPRVRYISAKEAEANNVVPIKTDAEDDFIAPEGTKMVGLNDVLAKLEPSKPAAPTTPGSEGAGKPVIPTTVFRNCTVEPGTKIGIVVSNEPAKMSDQLYDKTSGLFFKKFDELQASLPYSSMWTDAKSGLFVSMVESSTLKEVVGAGEQVKMVDDEGRKIIVTGTPAGLVVVGQAAMDSELLFYSAADPILLSGLIRSPGPILQEDEIELVLGSMDHHQPNLGQAMAELCRAIRG